MHDEDGTAGALEREVGVANGLDQLDLLPAAGRPDAHTVGFENVAGADGDQHCKDDESSVERGVGAHGSPQSSPKVDAAKDQAHQRVVDEVVRREV